MEELGNMLNKIFCEDCLIGMQRIPDGSVDAIICDLPYYKVVDDDFDNIWKSSEEYLEWVKKNIIEYKRIIKDNGNIFLFTSRQYNRHICMMLDDFFVEKRVIIWCRKRGFNTSRGKALASGYEPICYYCNGENGTFNNIKIKTGTDRKEYTEGALKDGICLSDVWNDIPALPHNSKEKTEHPTQKPVYLIERIVDIGTKEGDVILDNCMGSGTTAIAAIRKGRNFIGFEMNDGYYKIANERIGDELKQIKLW